MQIDRLQTVVQERELTSSQQETLYRSDLADREEEISRLKADLNILHEKLAQAEAQVSNCSMFRLTYASIFQLFIFIESSYYKNIFKNNTTLKFVIHT